MSELRQVWTVSHQRERSLRVLSWLQAQSDAHPAGPRIATGLGAVRIEQRETVLH